MNNQTQPLVSIIMPTFNTPYKYLKQSINSILNQTYKNFEFIIIDDGSKIKYKNILKLFSDPRIKIIYNDTNIGIAKSLNKALNLVQGEYVFRMDADDISLSKRLEISVNYLENHKRIDVLGCAAIEFGSRRRIKYVKCNNEIVKASMIFENPIIHPTVVFRYNKDNKRKIIYPIDMKSEDYGLWIKLLLDKKVIFYNIPKVLLKYRIHKNQITQKNSEELRKNAFVIQEMVFNGLKLDIEKESMNCFIIFSKGDRKISKYQISILENIFIRVIRNNNIYKIFKSEELLLIICQKIIKQIYIQGLYYNNFGVIYSLIKVISNIIRIKFCYQALN